MDTSPVSAGSGGLVDTELSVVHELRTLVLSRHAAIVVETPEEERADALLAAVARETNLTLFDWTITHGLVRRPGSQAVYGTQDPARMLASIQDLSVEGLFVLKDFGPDLTTPTVARAFRELIDQLAALIGSRLSSCSACRSYCRRRTRLRWSAMSSGLRGPISTAGSSPT